MMILLTSAGKAATDFTEGVHYQKLGTSIKNLSDSKKVEIVELFWYGCPHCFEFEPILKEWIFENKTKVNLIQVPAVFSKNWIHNKVTRIFVIRVSRIPLVKLSDQDNIVVIVVSIVSLSTVSVS